MVFTALPLHQHLIAPISDRIMETIDADGFPKDRWRFSLGAGRVLVMEGPWLPFSQSDPAITQSRVKQADKLRRQPSQGCVTRSYPPPSVGRISAGSESELFESEPVGAADSPTRTHQIAGGGSDRGLPGIDGPNGTA
jgi:hypothetical protein